MVRVAHSSAMAAVLAVAVGTCLLLACRGDEPTTGERPLASFGDAGPQGSVEGTSPSGSPGPSGSSGAAGSSSSSSTGGSTTGIDCYPDLDGDGFAGVGAAIRAEGSCPSRTTARRQPDDCDDTDPRAFPGATSASSTPRKAGGFDFDCDGSESALAVASSVVKRCAPQGINCTQVAVGDCDDTALCLTGGTSMPSHAPACGSNTDSFFIIACAREDAGACGFAPRPTTGYDTQTVFTCR